MVVIFLLECKSDDEGRREVLYEEGSALAQDMGWEFLETSAERDANVQKVFIDAVRLSRCRNPLRKVDNPKLVDDPLSRRPQRGERSQSWKYAFKRLFNGLGVRIKYQG
jgi:hypothetical protein